MELRQLRYFIAVAEELHFARAAERLHIAQQPVSFQIKQLEEELGVCLFQRTTRQVVLTEAGSFLLEEAYAALAHLEHGIQEAQRAQRGELGQVIIGYISTTLYTILPETVRRFRERFPSVEIVLHERVSPTMEEQLMSDELDAALSFPEGLENRFPELARQPLYMETAVVALPKSHPLSRRSSLSMSDLAKEAFVFFGRRQKSHAYDQFIANCQQAGFSPKIVQEAASEQAILGLVAAGVGISLVARCLKEVHAKEVVYIPTEPVRGSEIALVWKKERNLPQVKALLKIAQEVTSDLGF